MKRFGRVLPLILFVLLLAACRKDPTPTPTAAPTDEEQGTTEPQPTGEGPQDALVLDDDTLYVAIIWHQHQPVYFKDPETGIYFRPWVRAHATKDYLDMAQTLAQYPNVHATFNITPSLIRQLDDLNAGAQDLYWAHTEIPANELTDEQKRYLLERFFDTNSLIIDRFPRYRELADLRVGGTPEDIDAALGVFEEQDYRDLQILWNLAWIDPDYLAEEPLKALVDKGRDFSEEDKQVIEDVTKAILAEVIPYHAQLQQTGQIEVTMTPYAHPILPLLVNSDLAERALPDATLPPAYTYGQDAIAQVNLGVEFYEEHFGVPPRGMWPAEGSVAQIVVDMIGKAGIQWIASDETVLDQSLDDLELSRNSDDTVEQADALYRPYLLQGRDAKVSILFRDHLISDKVGFEYSGMGGQAAANDFMQRLENIQAQLDAEGATGPHLVTVLLDGENAWEYYENDGKEFLHALYQQLSEAENIRTVTPSEYLNALGEPDRKIANLFPGSWIDGTFSTWIGEEEENIGWTYLGQTRADLQKAIDSGDLSQEQVDTAMNNMYLAEGSDWFWWFGSDQSAGEGDDAFDLMFRNYLQEVYRAIGQEPPGFTQVPVIPETPIEPDKGAAGVMDSVAIDGIAAAGEWDDIAGYYSLLFDPLTGLFFGFDAANMYLRLDASESFAERSGDAFDIYLKAPDGANGIAFTGAGHLIGFAATHRIQLLVGNDAPTATLFTAAEDGSWTEAGPIENVALVDQTIELRLPFASFAPTAGSGTRINMHMTYSPAEGEPASLLIPDDGPGVFQVPDLPLPNLFMVVDDPAGDDHGPGTYTYPGNSVFVPSVFDFSAFQAGYDDNKVIFRLNLVGPINNHWGSPNGLSGQTIDIYIDVDGPENGSRLLLPGRNAALPAEYAWDYAIWAEGWTPGVYQSRGADVPAQVTGVNLEIVVNPSQSQVTISIPRDLIAGNPEEWAIAVVMLGQEGFPPAGVWRVRDVAATSEEWRFGGGAADANHTRIIDVMWPEGMTPTQEDMLGTYPSSNEDIDALGPDDFPQVPVLLPEQN